MIRIENRFQLKQVRAECQAETKQEKCRVLICGGTGCLAGGSAKLYEHMKELAAEHENVQVEIGPEIAHIGVHKSGCHGFCEMGPLMRIEPYGYLYLKVQESDCGEIFEKTVLRGQPVERLMFRQDNKVYPSEEEIPFYAKQTRLVLKNCGHIDAERIEAAIAAGAYEGLEKALFEMTPKAVIQAITDSKLRGRGGAGFPAGKKWSQVAAQKETVRYVVCNGDEGDPGAFMDRSVMEGNPHSVLEGMMIAGLAVGSDEGYIYVRAEYPTAVERLKIAIAQARAYGLLGENILGKGLNFDIEIRLGAGAFVCGEATALMISIEGNRGEPRLKPPSSAVRGLFGKPTVLNNVETFANVPQILRKGADWFRSIGTEKSTGTKVFALGGKINNSGLVEIPMGTTMREIIYDIGGGIPDGKAFKAAQTGGPSGGCIPAEHLDTPIDYESLSKLGSMMGSGGMIVMDENTCMVDIAKFFLEFTVDESCGKCPPCRIGTRRMLDILTRITEGKGTMEDLDELEELAHTIKRASLCGLGQSAPNPVLSTMKYFRDEYVAHVRDKKCPAGVCISMLRYVVDDEICKRCGICAKNCPVGAISGSKDKPYSIDQDKCIKCGVCMAKCPFKSIMKNA